MLKASVGAVEVTPLIDCAILMNPRMFVPGHGEEFAAEFAHMADERGLMPMAVTCYLVRSAGRTYLIDTGLGGRKRPRFPGGHLDQALADAGVAPSDIDVVLNTHMHIDHVGWNTVDAPDGSRVAFFPKAEYWFLEDEWEFWMQPEHLESPGNAHLSECAAPLMEQGRARLVKGETAIDEHLVYIPTPGHTPGHVAIGIASQGERGVVVGDASHHPAQLIHPDWSPSFDWDREMSAKTRDTLFDRAIDEERVWFAGHWEHPGIGRLVRLDGKRQFRAL